MNGLNKMSVLNDVNALNEMNKMNTMNDVNNRARAPSKSILRLVRVQILVDRADRDAEPLGDFPLLQI